MALRFDTLKTIYDSFETCVKQFNLHVDDGVPFFICDSKGYRGVEGNIKNDCQECMYAQSRGAMFDRFTELGEIYEQLHKETS